MTDKIDDLVAGDTLDFTVSVDGYPASDGWTLSYALRGPSAIDLTATPVGQQYRVQASAATTAAWIPGDYSWSRYVTLSGQRYSAGSGWLVIRPNLAAQVAGYDGRSQAEKALADAETALATFKSTNGRVKKYTIGQRSMEFSTSAEILQVISYWKTKVLNAQTADSIANGLGNPRNLMTRFR